MEEAINQLQDLGVTRGQAKRALARYNNDVARAADYIFSGATLSDDDDEEQSLVETDEQLAIRLSKEEEENHRLQTNNTNNPFSESNTPSSPAVIEEEPEPVHLDKGNVSNTNYDSSKWSIVPFKEDTQNFSATNNTTTYTSTTNQLASESSLTWWKDPEDPSERMALDDLPIGLRPPSYNFAYSPILIQALFHITYLAEAVLSFRPTPYTYGDPKNYWKGFGEPVPGYIMREVVTKRQVPSTVPTPMAASPTITPKNIPEEDLLTMDLTQKKFANLSIEDQDNDKSSETHFENSDTSSNINEEITESDLPPLIVETNPTEETVEFVDHVENELQLMPKCLQALAELQKIFAFLGNTARLYGSASHFVRALNNKLTSNGWEFSDKTFEVFLDLVINCLVEADEHSENSLDSSYLPIFRNIFLLKAKIEYGNDYDEEEVYNLTISIDKNMDSFHNCLDPLVYESYEMDETDAVSESSDEEADSFKFTTFKQIPPILNIIIENRTAPKKTNLQYSIDRKVYMDRYMIEKKEKALTGFKLMDACRKEIMKSKQEIEKLQGDGSNTDGKHDQRILLTKTLAYFEQKGQTEEETNSSEELETLKSILNNVKGSIESKLVHLESIIQEQRKKIEQIFDSDDMKENGYDLRATFHHDGKSGTGHYWAYIWVEPSAESLLTDIPSEGGWFRFCDAYVTAAKEEDIYNDPHPPFSLMYVSDSLPRFTKEKLYESIPDELKEFINSDNALLNQEIFEHDNPTERGDASIIATSEDDTGFVEKTNSTQIDAAFDDVENMSITFDDNTSVGTVVNGQQVDELNNESHNYSFNGPANNKLKNIVNAKIIEVSNYSGDDYRFMKDFDTFLARAQNQLILEHLYLLYSSEKTVDGNAELVIDETAARSDNDLKTVWQEYDSYLNIGKVVTQALIYFISKNYQKSLLYLLEAKRNEASWKTQAMLDTDVFNAYSGLETLSFDDIIEKYGKVCLKALNKSAFDKACNVSYRSRGLEDAIKLAYHAQTIIGPDNIQKDEVYGSLGELWLSFTEQENVGSTLTQNEAESLNTLILIYLEGQIDKGADIQIRNEVVSTNDSDDEENENDEIFEIEKLPLWERYKRACVESESILSWNTP